MTSMCWRSKLTQNKADIFQTKTRVIGFQVAYLALQIPNKR